MEKGLYIHVPFCVKKCEYCDFYSLPFSSSAADEYLNSIISEMQKYKGHKVSTLYIGGGTPSLLGANRIARLLSETNRIFGDFTESTVEVNPTENLYDFFVAAKQNGINRVSVGMQSADDRELISLTRRHTAADTERTVNDALRAGIDNISLDLMLAIPLQTEKSLTKSIQKAVQLNPRHISAYILKTEVGTPFYKKRALLDLPDDDKAADMYLQAVAELESAGYLQYEISNFAQPGFESRHNINYWKCGEYIGIGPAAHGFLDGTRYKYEKSLEKFLQNPTPVSLGVGGDRDEFFMLNLRLRDGLDIAHFSEKYNLSPKDAFYEKAEIYSRAGYLTLQNGTIRLTASGFLVSNTIISELLAVI